MVARGDHLFWLCVSPVTQPYPVLVEVLFNALEVDRMLVYHVADFGRQIQEPERAANSTHFGSGHVSLAFEDHDG